MAKLEIQALKTMVSNASDLTLTARERSEKARDYYDDIQWTAQEEAELKRRKQPVLTKNRIKRKIDAMVGIEQQGRTDPRAFPRSPKSEQGAEAATKALTYIDDNTRFDVKKSAAFENMLIEGYGGVEVVVEEVRGQFEIVVNRVRWEEIFFDPHSREKDFSDASYIGTQKWMSLDKALSIYDGVYEGDNLEELLQTNLRSQHDGDTFEDRPFGDSTFQWVDKKARRVRVAQMYYQRSGVWYLAIFCGGGEIFHDKSPYLDEDGEPTCAIELMTAYIDRENRRYGVVQSMISAQDEINKRSSKLLHQLNSRQTIGVKGAVDDIAAMKRELGMPDGHVALNMEQFEDAIRAGIKPFEIIQNQDQIAGQFNLLTEAKTEIDMLGPNASLLGQLGGDQSGRAIIAQQNAGFAELAPIYDSLNDWTIRCYRAMWARVKQFWTEERWVRVTDSLGKPEFVGLNIPQQPVVQIGSDGMPQIVPQMENAVAEIDVDIVIDDTPDYTTVRHEQFEKLADMAARGIPIPPEMLIEASDMPNKAELLERMEQLQQQNMQMQQASMQAEQQIKMIEAEKTQSETAKNQAQTVKTMAEAQRTSLGF